MCMNEVSSRTRTSMLTQSNTRQVHFGAGWPLSFAGLFRSKVQDARVLRKIALEGHRFTPQEALEAGLVDQIIKGDTEAIIDKAREVGEAASAMSVPGVWGVIKVRVHLALSVQ